MPGRGKDVLVRRFRLMRKRRQLVTDLCGKRSVVLFFVDKDIDDQVGRLMQSDHLVYSEFYSVENYWFRYGNIVNAMAIGGGIEHKAAETVVSATAGAWLRRAAEAWQTWVEFCLFIHRNGIRGQATYRVCSQFHDVAFPYSLGCAAKRASLYAQVSLDCGMSRDALLRKRSIAGRVVRELFSANRFDSVFAGSWYVHFLVADVKTAAAGGELRQKSLHQCLTSALQATVDFSGDWTGRYIAAIERAVRKLVP